MVPLDDYAVGGRIVVSAGAVEQVLRAMPRDTQFKGLLEHCDIELPEPGGMDVVVHLNESGKRRHQIHLKRMNFDYPDYQKVFRDNWAERRQQQCRSEYVCLNRKRLSNIVAVMDRVCNYDGAFAPTWWSGGIGGSVFMRALNELSGQRMVCLFSGSDTGWLELDVDEAALLHRAPVAAAAAGAARKIIKT
jgi:hypothetical protein